MNIIETIRAEIERRREANMTKNGFPAGTLCAVRIEAYDELLAFLGTLQEPNPSKSVGLEGLDEAAERLADEHGFVKNPSCKPSKYSWQAVRDVFIEAAKAGAEWMAEWGSRHAKTPTP